MKIIHISDTHGKHNLLQIPSCDVLIHSGDIGGRTDLKELNEFLIWFEAQNAICKIFIGGNHDLVLDKNEAQKEKDRGNMFGWSKLMDEYKAAMDLIQSYKVVYLNGKDYVFQGVKFWGSPYTPSFHREFWAFNKDRGEEIMKEWAKVPSDVNVLITHGPPFGILDEVDEAGRTAWNKDGHVGCEDLMNVIKKRLSHLQIHFFGHIHDNYGVIDKSVTNSRRLTFSNGAVLDNRYNFTLNNLLEINKK